MDDGSVIIYLDFFGAQFAFLVSGFSVSELIRPGN